MQLGGSGGGRQCRLVDQSSIPIPSTKRQTGYPGQKRLSAAARAGDLGSVPSTKQLTTSLTAGAGEFNALFWLLRAPGMHILYKHTCKQNAHKHK